MSLFCLSFTHQRVPIAFRERLYFDADSLANACARFRCGSDQPSRILEFLVLSTCNRTEIYGVDCEPMDAELSLQSKQEIYNFVGESRGIDSIELAERSTWYRGPAAATHLCRVACGLESLVLGEPQILGQVGDSMRMGLIMNSAGAILSQLFQAAIRAGRRARHETAIGKNSLNVSTVAVNTVEKYHGSLENRTVVMLGAGEMAELALEQMKKLGADPILIVNRTLKKAEELAAKFDGQPYVFEQIRDVLGLADILVSSTGAPHTLISREMIEDAMRRRPQQKLFVLDIAVPRDVESGIEELPFVDRCDVDDLHMVTGESAKLRESEIPLVEQIIVDESDRFLAWCRSVGVETIVRGMRKKCEDIRQSAFRRLENMMPAMSANERKIIEKFSHALVKKILHDPTMQLRAYHGSRGAVDHAEAIRQLFKLSVSETSEPNPPIEKSTIRHT